MQTSRVTWAPQSLERKSITTSLLFFFLNFLCYIGVEMINNAVIVSDREQSDSKYLFFFQTLSPFRSLHNIEQRSMCYGPPRWC